MRFLRFAQSSFTKSIKKLDPSKTPAPYYPVPQSRPVPPPVVVSVSVVMSAAIGYRCSIDPCNLSVTAIPFKIPHNARMRTRYVRKSCVNIEEARSKRSNLRRFDLLSRGVSIRHEISEET